MNSTTLNNKFKVDHFIRILAVLGTLNLYTFTLGTGASVVVVVVVMVVTVVVVVVVVS